MGLEQLAPAAIAERARPLGRADRLLPEHLEVRDEAADDHDVERPLADDVIRDVDVAAAGIRDLG
jgi:hypothetical protein